MMDTSLSNLSFEEDIGLYDETDEDFRNFQELRDVSRPSVELWTRVAGKAASNSDQLIDEMWTTLKKIAAFMRELELSAKERRIKRLTHLTGDWVKFCQNEERFAASIESGKKTMASLSLALNLGPAQRTYIQPADLYSRIAKFEEYSSGRGARSRIRELTVCLKEVIGRFAQICDSEGIEHDLPVVCPTDYPPLIDALPKMKKRISNFQLPPVKIPEVKKEPESKNIVYDFGDQIDYEEEIADTGSLLPVDFLWEYCRRDRSTPMYEDMGTVGKAAFSQEYVVICRVRQMSGEGKAKKKMTAKQCSAAMLIKSLLNKQRLDRLSPESRPLSDQERLLAIRVISEVLDFEKDLDTISKENYHRSPIYTPLVNSTGNHIRCKALGYNAIGYGRSKEVARRMSAKLILDRYKDAKDLAKKKTKEKFEASKCNVSPIKSS